MCVCECVHVCAPVSENMETLHSWSVHAPYLLLAPFSSKVAATPIPYLLSHTGGLFSQSDLGTPSYILPGQKVTRASLVLANGTLVLKQHQTSRFSIHVGTTGKGVQERKSCRGVWWTGRIVTLVTSKVQADYWHRTVSETSKMAKNRRKQNKTKPKMLMTVRGKYRNGTKTRVLMLSL